MSHPEQMPQSAVSATLPPGCMSLPVPSALLPACSSAPPPEQT